MSVSVRGEKTSPKKYKKNIYIYHHLVGWVFNGLSVFGDDALCMYERKRI